MVEFNAFNWYVSFYHGATPPVGQGLLIIKDSLSHSHTPQSVGLLWTSDQPEAQASTRQHTTLTTDKHPCPPVGFEPTIPASERPQTHALDCSATGIGIHSEFLLLLARQPPVGQGLLIIKDSLTHSDTPHSVGRRDLCLTNNTHKRPKHPCPRWDSNP